jgi:hypothetical protein
MKKLLSLWSMTVLLLFGAIAVTSCGDDDDDDNISDQKENQNHSDDNDPIKAIPAGYYGLEYEIDGNKVYGNIGVLLFKATRDAEARGDRNYLTSGGLFNKYGGRSDYLGLYVYVKNGKRYVMSLYNEISNTNSDLTYLTKTYTCLGSKSTVYFNIAKIDTDDFALITSDSGYSYNNGYLNYQENKYKRFDFDKKIDWIEEICSEEVDKLNGNH